VVIVAGAPTSGPSQGGWRASLALAVEVRGGRAVSAAVENALRTLLALVALDPKRTGRASQLTSWEAEGARLTRLNGTPPAILAVGNGLIVVGTSERLVAEFASDKPAGPDPRFKNFRTEFFPKAETFAYLDLPEVCRVLDAHRADLAHRLAAKRNGDEEGARRDLDTALSLLGLFRGAYATIDVDSKFTSTRRTFALIAREPGAKAP
jgi:hypothetical protein